MPEKNNFMEMNENIKLLHGDCIELLPKIPDESIDAIITDPPYGYLKNQKLDIPFNEPIFFNEAKRVLKSAGFIVMFGRGTSFYRWNTILADIGFMFKEEIIWNKVQTSSPLLPINRVHETISIHTKGKGKINKTRIPYLEMKGHDIEAIKRDIKRLLAVFSNAKSLEAVKKYLEQYSPPAYCQKSVAKHFASHTGFINGCDRSLAVIDSLNRGLREKTILHIYGYPYTTKHDITCTKNLLDIDRPVKVARSMEHGCVEKSIMQQTREHYTMQHPTQKPLRLMERLMALVTQESALVLDPFMGSASTGVACINTDRKFIGMELDDNYFSIAKARIENAIREKERSLFSEQGAAANA